MKNFLLNKWAVIVGLGSVGLCILLVIPHLKNELRWKNNIDPHPKPSTKTITVPSEFIINKWEGINVSGADLSGIDLSTKTHLLRYITFDNRTIWPDELPMQFDPANIMDNNKDPGLNIRALHDKGYTGKNVGTAIIDQGLIDHIEYRNQLRYYKDLNKNNQSEASMHGSAVASIAVGQNVGVAPESDLYYVSVDQRYYSALGVDYSYIADGICAIIDINDGLPQNRKIRVISISIAYDSTCRNIDRLYAAIKEAEKQNIYVMTVSDEMNIQGLSKILSEDANSFSSYRPALSMEDQFYYKQRFGLQNSFSGVYIPMDCRCVASSSGPEDYINYAVGGLSWCVPYLAGVYALCCQVHPSISPEEFRRLALETGRKVSFRHNGVNYELDCVLDPEAIVEVLLSSSLS